MNDRPEHAALTDEDGRFRLELEGGHYAVEATQDGFFQPRRLTLTLTIGEEVRGISLRISPTSTITGRVLDEDGAPINLTEVTAFREQYIDGRRRMGRCDIIPLAEGARQSTNERGEYRLFGLTPGEYFVTASIRGCDTFAGYFPNVTDPADASTVVVVPGVDSTGIDIRLPNDAAYRAEFDTEELSGTRESSAGAFQVVRRSRSGIASSVIVTAGSDRGSLRRIGENQYATPPLAPGSYDVYYLKYLSRSVGHLSFNVVDRDVNAGTMVFRPLVRVQGNIRTAESVALGAGYEHLEVAFKPLEPWNAGLSALYTLPLQPTTSGAFRHELSEGRYRINVFGLPSDLYLASVRYGVQDVTRQGFFEAVAVTADQVIELVIDGPGGIVEGIVRDERDDPAPDSQVVLVPSADRRQNLDLFRAVFTDQTGRFSVRGVPPGDYGVLAWEDVPEGAWLNAEFLGRFETRMERIRVEKGDREVLDIGIIAGRD
jgi:hypothetical protein